MTLSDKDMAVIFKKDVGDYMIAAENLRTDEQLSCSEMTGFRA
jgi:hypothetical protein